MNSIASKLSSTQAANAWNATGIQHHHGIALPLFSLHSKESTGIGEYLDLIPMIDWCKENHFDTIQLLPLNDTGLDVSPYNALSAFALNPIHISLSTLPGVDPHKIQDLQKLNSTTRVDYQNVRQKKHEILLEYFSKSFAEISQSVEYQQFIKSHRWLNAYSLFKSIKEAQGWKSWESWPLALKSPSERGLDELYTEFEEKMNFHTFLQYLCFSQFSKVRQKAVKENVKLKGDIPILISRDSADAWSERHLFLLHFAAGAPPDMYSKEGQYWGFPLYDWEAMEKEKFRWWQERLAVASNLYDLYRIDHVVGFYRIWAIPLGRSAKEGNFFPRDEKEWIPQGEKIMEMMLKASPLLPIGEDLGLVPVEVKESLTALGIPGTKMMRWERRWEEDGSFISPQEYGPISMTTVSTHDSDTLKMWWRHFPKEAKLFCEFKEWDYTPFLSYEHHLEILRDAHHSPSLFHINHLMEYLALFPDLISSDPQAERINIPGKILPTNWTYRFRPSIEELFKHEKLKSALKQII